MAEFRMPSLGADMEAGTLVEWLKKPGEKVARGDVIAVVETQKGAIEVECFETGTLAEYLVEPGAKVPVGTPLARIETESERHEEPRPATPKPEAAEPAQAPKPAAPKPEPEPQVPPPSPTPERARRRVSPAARKIARERGIDLSGIEGSGPGGAVVSADLPEAAARPAASAPRGRLDLGEMRKAIAAAMARSKREIPHYYLAHDIDLTAAETWLARTNGARTPEDRLLMGVLLVKAVARALARFPEFNGTWEDAAFRPGEGIHVGVAIAIRGGGLIAPAIRDADGLSLDDLMAHLRDLVARVRSGALRSSELGGATATVSSLGDRGVGTLYGVIYPPQVALIGFGRPSPRPWAVGEALAVRTVLTATLAADHRASDGHRGALLLREIDTLLQDPEAL
ncbi:dihydrolipoamide acetyltransferase family protein [Futiania mangrovi]|uniref:Dihydrolipoamide acetyltransferase component of pyruvate dehydrogenase complex n=1 Tax=Futiania mangrovi TaxID=2959716 RepID=A0A9J6PBL0_9PROT|nr:dihydrolipoamide acetyltransferase family protein [Futiania mangrovii]MCP1337532.1 2-oxo acid dehydrogenase subunit E2 [Futiania mangrovii]